MTLNCKHNQPILPLHLAHHSYVLPGMIFVQKHTGNIIRNDAVNNLLIRL